MASQRDLVDVIGNGLMAIFYVCFTAWKQHRLSDSEWTTIVGYLQKMRVALYGDDSEIDEDSM